MIEAPSKDYRIYQFFVDESRWQRYMDGRDFLSVLSFDCAGRGFTNRKMRKHGLVVSFPRLSVDASSYGFYCWMVEWLDRDLI